MAGYLAFAAAVYLVALAAYLAWASLRQRAERFRIRYLGRDAGEHVVQIKSRRTGQVWLARGDDRAWRNSLTGKTLPCWLTRLVYRFMLRRDKERSDAMSLDMDDCRVGAH